MIYISIKIQLIWDKNVIIQKIKIGNFVLNKHLIAI